MSANERIRELRKSGLHMTMEEFGSILGISKSGVSEIESGRRSVTDQHIRLLTSSPINGETISEAWLRDGEGEMFVQRTRSQIIADFANDVMEDVDESFRKRFVEALSKLSVEDWEVLNKIVDELSAKKEG